MISMYVALRDLVPPKVEYRLTEAGRTFTPIIASIRDGGERHLGDAMAGGG
jgi:DNA-binding HxlR family transcriptional regulator